jgi:radical SAM protein with 4Fe4S-binding SPASM domain
MLSISESAQVYPCNHLYLDEFAMGDATKQSLAAILGKASAIFRPVPVDAMSPCKSCELRYICGGSCRATAYHEKGRLDVASSECSFLKDVIVQTLWDQCLADPAAFRCKGWIAVD